MAEKDKRYYWLKLKRDFFKRHDIQVIESMPNGKDYILFYLKLLCESVDHEGNLRFSEEIPYNEQMLSAITNTNIDIVRSAVKLFSGLKMMDIMDDGTYYMTKIEKMIGSETYWAEKKRNSRALEAPTPPLLDNVQQLSNESPMCPSKSKRIEKEKDKDIEIEIDRENESGFSFDQSLDIDNLSSFSTGLSTREEAKRKALGGELGAGVVILSDEQMESLLDMLSIEEFNHYVAVVRDCELSGRGYKKKTHYEAIREMALADRRI